MTHHLPCCVEHKGIADAGIVVCFMVEYCHVLTVNASEKKKNIKNTYSHKVFVPSD